MKIYRIFITVLFLSLSVNAQSLQDYLNIAEKNNPELQAVQYQYESALEKVNEVGSLPNITIGAGYFIQEAETRVGAQKAKLSVNQKLPWFGTLDTKEESASFRAEAKMNNVEFTKRKLFLDVKTVYFELIELKAKESILKENNEILKIFEELALNELQNNRSTMIDVLKIRMEKNELENNLNTILENIKAKQIAFNLLLNRDKELFVNVSDSIIIDLNEEMFGKELISKNPRLLQLSNLENALEKDESATKKEGLPNFGIGLDYVFVESREIENLADNGKDIVMPMITVSFPLFSKKYSSKQKQLQLEQKAIAKNKINIANQLQTLFEKASGNINSSKISIDTHTKNIEEAERAKKVLLAAYETSSIDFEQLLEVQQLKLKFQLKKVVSEKEYAIQRSTL
ncbi:MAG: TolC family protein, partial [Bacteroidota bacterium]